MLSDEICFLVDLPALETLKAEFTQLFSSPHRSGQLSDKFTDSLEVSTREQIKVYSTVRYKELYLLLVKMSLFPHNIEMLSSMQGP